MSVLKFLSYRTIPFLPFSYTPKLYLYRTECKDVLKNKVKDSKFFPLKYSVAARGWIHFNNGIYFLRSRFPELEQRRGSLIFLSLLRTLYILTPHSKNTECVVCISQGANNL
jgi:hypothetical protein